MAATSIPAALSMADPEPQGIRDQVRHLKKERILAEAQRLFFERGFKGTSLDAIAEALDMTKPFVYGIYDKKTDILFDIALRNIRTALQAIQSAIELPGSCRHRLAEAARRLTMVCIDHQEAVAVFFREEAFLDPEHVSVINDFKEQVDRALAGLLQEGVEAGEFKLQDVRTASLAIGGMISWSYTWYRPTGRLSADDLKEHMACYTLRIAGAKDD